jgi:hypothetical protein
VADVDAYSELVDNLVEAVRAAEKLVRAGDGEYRLRKLIDVYEWALERQAFKVGDEAVVVADPFPAGHGFAHYNDLWATEPTGEIVGVDFIDGWVYSVRLDVGGGVDKVFMFGERFLWKPGVRLTYGQDAP